MKNQDNLTVDLGTREFFQKTLDSLLSHMAILDEDGAILAVNAPWRRFAIGNGLDADRWGPGANYLGVCESAKGQCAEEAHVVARGIRDVAAGRRDAFALEYPCHSPNEQNWFTVRVTRFEVAGRRCVVVSHDNITQRKLAEFKLQEANDLLLIQATRDGLTSIANRRSFDQALEREWARHAVCPGPPLTVALLDVDCFKQFNDHHGHQAGDDVLKEVARAMAACVRPTIDLVARYGGEEFAVILPRTEPLEAIKTLAAILEALRALAISHPQTRVSRKIVTASLGYITGQPADCASPAEFLKQADQALYQAKNQGRDRMVGFSGMDVARG